MKKSSHKWSSEPIAKEQLASMMEHTLLGSEVDEKMIIAHIDEAIKLNVLGVCLPLAFVPLAQKHIRENILKLVTVVDFPSGQGSVQEKAREAETAKLMGADEIDMVMDHSSLNRREYHLVLTGLLAVVQKVAPIPVKVIVETSALSREMLAIACALVALSKAAFIKTSTGFHSGGARAEDISLMRSLLPDDIGIKASGGIRSHEQALTMIRAGATRIGCSRSKEILDG